MASVDLTRYLTYIRKQGGPGCWGYATLAIWDVLNEIYSTNPPNLSMNLWLMFHKRRALWEPERSFKTPDGRYHNMSNSKGDPVPGPEFGVSPFFHSFGITTEGTEPHIAMHSTNVTGWFTEQGINEAQNYKLAEEPKEVNAISSEAFKECLNKYKPIRLEAGPHVVALLGYDDAAKTFTFVDSSGDQAHNEGFGTFTYAEIDAGNTNWLGKIHKAYTIKIMPPRAVPVAEIWIRHNVARHNLNLWLSAVGSAQQKKKIWPPYELQPEKSGFPFDNSHTLHYRVPLPREIVWPPEADGQVALDLYDSNAFAQGTGGGEVLALRAAFGAHIVNSDEVLNHGPVNFAANEYRRFTIP